MPPALRPQSSTVRSRSAPEGVGAESNGRFKIDGSAGALRVALHGDVNANSEDLTIAGLARLRATRVDLSGDIAAPDGAALIGLLGLDRFITVEKGAGRVTVSARGAFDSEMAVEGRLVAGALDAAAKGRLRLTGSRGADRGPGGRRSRVRTSARHAPPVRRRNRSRRQLSARLALAEGNINLSDLTGTVAGTEINGRLTVGFADPVNVGGELTLGALHLPATHRGGDRPSAGDRRKLAVRTVRARADRCRRGLGQIARRPRGAVAAARRREHARDARSSATVHSRSKRSTARSPAAAWPARSASSAARRG